MTETTRPEPHDRHIYSWVMLYREHVKFFVKAIEFYESLIDQELSDISDNEHLNALLTDDVKREFGLEKSVSQIQRTKEWLQRELDKGDETDFECSLDLSHGQVRFIKSICNLYIKFLYLQRNELSKRPNISTRTLEAVDVQITKYGEMFKSGVFKDASPYPLLVDELLEQPTDVSEDTPNSLSNARRPKPVLIDSIEILDSELRGRCLDLFNQFEEQEQPERHDTVITEATRILENRLRILTKSEGGGTGVDLAAKAFAGATPMFIISDIKAEQDAAHLLFRGAFGFIRNRAHHKLLSDLPPERVLQMIGYIDYLISVLESAKYNDDYEG